jgi:hypothetical protein
MTITTKLNIGDTFWIPFNLNGEIVALDLKVKKIGITDEGIFYLGDAGSFPYPERAIFKTEQGALKTCFEEWKEKKKSNYYCI